MRNPISAVMATATAVAVLAVTLVTTAVSLRTMTNLAKDKTVAVAVAKAIHRLQVGEIQSLYGVLQRSLSSADCYRAYVLASHGI